MYIHSSIIFHAQLAIDFWKIGSVREEKWTKNVEEEKLGRGISRHTPFPLGIS